MNRFVRRMLLGAMAGGIGRHPCVAGWCKVELGFVGRDSRRSHLCRQLTPPVALMRTT